MSKSEAFSKIRKDTLDIVICVPYGKVTTFKEIGSYMTVMPRHIAYILNQLKPQEKDEIPWYRVVGESGKLGKEKCNARGQSQRELLESEGVHISGSVVAKFESVFVSVVDLESGVKPAQDYSGRN